MIKKCDGYTKENPETIQELFGSIAKQYDRTNAILSFQMHRYWNKALVRSVTGTSSPSTLLDLCCGTGEIAFTHLKKSKSKCCAYLLDFCKEMLACAKSKVQPWPHEVVFLQADAQQIPLPEKSVQCATIAYGIRNVKKPSRCIEEVFRVLEPGGKFGILELTRPKNSALRFGHQLYLRGILPFVGKCVARNKQAYEYLCRSIQNFVEPCELEQILCNAGFEKVKIKPLTGGIATLILGQKPL